MKIDKIEIENFKLFANNEFQFNPQFNLIIGVNGSGKTSLLRAISVALGGWAHAYMKSETNHRPIRDNEIREIQIKQRFNKSQQTSIKASGTSVIIDDYNHIKEIELEWIRKRVEGDSETALLAWIKHLSDPVKNFYDLNDVGKNVLKYMEDGNSFNLPLIAFYECDRLWLQKSEIKLEDAATQKYSHFDPYNDCFHTGADDNEISIWLIKHELASLQKGTETPILKSIRRAAVSALDDCTDFKFDFEESRVMIEFSDGSTTPFEHLSDGQRTILGLFCDIARRAAILNPHLGGDASTLTSGVVLIDELDLHLHPKWKRRIIEDLRNTFPNIQFICSTHSPFLIQSLRSGEELVMLDGEPLAEYKNKGIEEIVKNMGVERPDVAVNYEKMKEAAKSFLQLLDENPNTPGEKQEEYKSVY